MANTNNTAVRTVTVSTKYGNKSVVTTLDLNQAIQTIRADRKASSFALDLVQKSAKWGLSPKQADWAIFLAQESLDKASNASSNVSSNPVPIAAATPALGDTKALFGLFGSALLKLRYPRLRLSTADGRLVVIKVSGSGSKNAGSLNVTNGARYGSENNVFFGYVHQDGSCTVKNEGVLELLKALAADPAGVAARQGLASGSCCFCAKPLSDSEAGSSEIGYGPICAAHWGLPWQTNGKAEAVAAPVAAKPKRVRKSKASSDVVEAVAKASNVEILDGSPGVSKLVLESASRYLASLAV